jgi:heme/copper-type cytochrome/quinol oxidase subunit 2
MDTLPNLDLPLAALAQVLFYVLLLIYIIFTVILYYHWQNYSMSKAVTAQTYIAYFVTTIPLLLILGLSTLAL